MNPLEAQLDYPFGDTLPAPGTLLEVAPGVQWLRMGLPFALNHINLWLLEDERDGVSGWTVIDCGIANDSTRAAWESIFHDALGGKPILRVLVTHCHPDHVGLADWICRRWQVPLWMSAGEYTFARMMSLGLPGFDGATLRPHFERHGIADAHLLDQLVERAASYPALAPAVPHAYVRLHDQQHIRIGANGWRIITGFGHSPEHAALSCPELKLLISGDMVLPRISTNVSVAAIEPDSNPVQNYLDSLDKFSGLATDTLVLPSHGKPFRGLAIRIAQLNAHHAERLAEVATACATPQSAAQIVPMMFARALDAHQLGFALGEALAHLHQLWLAGQLQRREGADGVLRFVTPQPAKRS